MGIHNNSLIGSSGQQGYQISRSVRLRSSASAYLDWTTTASFTSQRIFTFSFWLKRGILSNATQNIFDRNQSTNLNQFTLGFSSDDTFGITARTSGTTTVSLQLITSGVFRDPSAWYHFMIAVDNTQATLANRGKIYVNGVLQSLGTQTATQNVNYHLLTGLTYNIGRTALGSTNYVDGYLTEFNFIDGQQLDPSSFGETNAITGVWQPKAYSGTYGTNGFELNFSDNSNNTAATIGKDYSGNGNNWTPNVISVTAGATYDSMLDSPTPYADGGNGRGNYCTLNPLENPHGFTLSGGNLDMSGANAWRGTRATIGVTSGKWYWEYVHTSATVGGGTGISTQAGYTWAQMATNDPGSYSGGWQYSYSGQKSNNGSTVAYGAAFTQNDVVGVAFDADTGTLTFYKNGASQGTAYTGLTSGPYFPTDAGPFGGAVYNFGQRPFVHTPPTGFKALNTQNLPAPTISNGANYMNASLWTGDASTSRAVVSNLAFSPDFVWTKDRSVGYQHSLQDTVRGTGAAKKLYSSLTGAENGVNSVYGHINSFDANGFTVATGSSGAQHVNASGVTYVGWQWNAGGSTVTNTDGTVSAQVRANATAGFSVVTFTAPASGNFSAGHGLNVTPGMVITKVRGRATNWITWHNRLNSGSPGTSYYVDLNLTGAQSSFASVWGSTGVTSSVIGMGVGASCAASDTIVAYCFAAVAGYSAFDSYTGNGSADGPFVFLGFRPRFVMFKNSSNATGYDWIIWDSARQSYNVMGPALYPNLSNAESTPATNQIDVLSSGFKLRNTGLATNGNTNTYIYAAFAENPFKNSLAR